LHHVKEKQPLGVMPKVIWYEQRICDLSRAIYEYVSSGRFEQAYWWSIELTGILRMRENHLESQPAESSNAETLAQHTTGNKSKPSDITPI
jgi:hypothetical protein